MATPKYPWLRRDDETDKSWEAFECYLSMGRARSLKAVGEKLGKSGLSGLGNWSSQYEWTARCRAFDAHVTNATLAPQMEDYAKQVSTVRHQHIELANKLMRHLDSRLDDYIAKNLDPSVRWTQAFAAATTVHAKALSMDTTGRDSESVAKVRELLTRVLDLPGA